MLFHNLIKDAQEARCILDDFMDVITPLQDEFLRHQDDDKIYNQCASVLGMDIYENANYIYDCGGLFLGVDFKALSPHCSTLLRVNTHEYWLKAQDIKIVLSDEQVAKINDFFQTIEKAVRQANKLRKRTWEALKNRKSNK